MRQNLAGLDEPGQERLQAALEAEVRRRLDAFQRGIAAYRNHPYQRTLPEPAVGWQSGTTRILDYGGDGQPLLVVPSLINRAYVLDLTAGTSLLRWLQGAGFRPFLVDWGAPAADEAGFDLSDYVAGRLGPGLDWTTQQAGGPVPVIGYCMGGLLAVALALLRPDDINALALLATPWDFQAGSADQAAALAGATQMWAPALDLLGVLPVDIIQALFWTLDPLSAVRKFIRFADMDQQSAKATVFVALEDWLNDGVPLVAGVARACLTEWYGDNTPVRGEWQVQGQPVEPGRIGCRTLVVISEKDRIVPMESAAALAGGLPDPTVIHSTLGHIGMVVGSGARSRVWQPLADWLAAT